MAEEKALEEYCQTDEGGSALLSVFASRVYLHDRTVDWKFLFSPRQLGRLHSVLQDIDGREFIPERYPSVRFEVEWHETGSGKPVVRAVRMYRRQ